MTALASRVSALVSGPELLETVLSHGNFAGVSTDDLPRLKAYAARWRSSMLDVCLALGADGDEDDFYRTLAAIWLELRFEWQRNSLVSNYGTVLHGRAAPLPLAFASASSTLMARLESLLDEAALARMGEFAAQLIEGTHGLLSGETPHALLAGEAAPLPGLGLRGE